MAGSESRQGVAVIAVHGVADQRPGDTAKAIAQLLVAAPRSDAGGAAQPVDVYEMYWADLSRLASGVPRILTELFTLLFRLSQLGRDTVALATRQFVTDGRSLHRWQWFSNLQAGLDWAFA